MAVVLPESAEKAAYVEAMFDRIAERYDRMNRTMTFGMDRAWRRATMDAAAVAPGDRVLDLGCGTGDLLVETAARGALGVGIDPSAGMLAVARKRGVPGTLVRADALAMPLADASVDVVVSAFVLRNLTDLEAALREAARILLPGGRMALLEVSTPSWAPARAVHHFYFHSVVPRLGRFLARDDAYAYLPASTVYLPAWRELAAIVEGAGFEGVDRRILGAGAVQIVVARRNAEGGA